MNTTQPAAGLTTYYPEMGDAKPTAAIEARVSHAGGFVLKTALILKGRGVTLTSTVGQRFAYRVTEKAFAAIQAQHSVSMETLL